MIGEKFHTGTMYQAGTSVYKKRDLGRKITLPEPDKSMGKKDNLWKLIGNRRSHRDFSDKYMTRKELSILLWATQGITEKSGHGAFRASPSAGGLYPNDTYLCINNVEGIERGMYLYHPDEHILQSLEVGDMRKEITKAGLGQGMLGECSVVFIWSSVIERASKKYQERAYRYMYLDAGHICQNLYLAAEVLGMGCCGVAAFYDDYVNSLIGADGIKEAAIYMAAVGWKK